MEQTISLPRFGEKDQSVVAESAVLAEEIVSDFYKMSEADWRGIPYDIKTLDALRSDEILHGPFAQVIRYRSGSDLLKPAFPYDFFKICLQDHAILTALKAAPEIDLFPFALYILTHELVHIVRFGRFLQYFDAGDAEREAEERRVDARTRQILQKIQLPGLKTVLLRYPEPAVQIQDFSQTGGDTLR